MTIRAPRAITFHLAFLMSLRVNIVRVNLVRSQLFVLSIMSTSFLGCGGKDNLDLMPVTGVVEFKGGRLGWGEVVFTPQNGTRGPSAVGVIQSDGTYSMRTGSQEGAAVGEHKVTVHHRRPPTEQERLNLKITESLIPDEYWKEAETPLRVEVKEDESNEYDIKL